jgi:hypothetical protein
MFKAVRENSDGAGATFRHHRLRRTARLFLFEFVVVLLGVLAAQMLQNWAASRQARDEARLAVEQTRRDIAGLAAITRFWERSAPCLIDHVTTIARVAAAGGTLSSQQLGRPALPTPDAAAWSDATRSAVEQNIGVTAVQDHDDNAVAPADIIRGYNREIANEWAVFGLLDPAFGQPSALDRANVRLAAARVRTLLKMQAYKVREMKRVTDRLGIAEDRDAASDYREATDKCGLLKNW